MTDRYDVIVVGVGSMGSAACYHLAMHGARVLGLVQSDSGAALPQLQGAAGDAALVLPRTPASARLEVLRLLFARLLP